MKTAKHLLVTFRTGVSLISYFFVIMFLIISNNTDYSAYVKGVSIFLITGVGFIFNDVFDYEKDKIAKKNRPIASNKLKKDIAIRYASLISIIAIIIPSLYFDFKAALIILEVLIGVILYSPFSKKFSLFKGLFTALLCCCPLFYGSYLANANVSILFYGFVIIFIVGREILLDVYDLHGDLLSKRKTIPYFLGIQKSNKLSWILMISGTGLLFYYSYSNSISRYISLICVILTCICSILPLRYEKYAVGITRVVMMLSSLIFPFL